MPEDYGVSDIAITGECVSDETPEYGQAINITADIYSSAQIDSVWVEISTGQGNDIEQMTYLSGDTWFAVYNVRDGLTTTFDYVVYVRDKTGAVEHGIQKNFDVWNQGPYPTKQSMDFSGLCMWSERTEGNKWLPEITKRAGMGIKDPGEQNITVSNADNPFPLFLDAEYVKYTIANDSFNIILDSNAHFVGYVNLSYMNISASGSSAYLNYSAITYQDASHDQKWKSDPYFNSTTNKFYLLSGSGIITYLNTTITDNNASSPKLVGVGNLVGDFNFIVLFANKTFLNSSIMGVGYTDFYFQYAPDDSYENITFIDTYSACEKLTTDTNSSSEYSKWNSTFLGLLTGAESTEKTIDLKLQLDVEYFPLSYQSASYDQKFSVSPVFTGEKLYLGAGSGIITYLNTTITDNNASSPKLVGVGDFVGEFHAELFANKTFLNSSINGTGYTNFYFQYAPDNSYENITFIDTYSACEKLTTDTNSSSEYSSWNSTFLGLLTGAGATEKTIDLKLQLDVEYFPLSYQSASYDQKFSVSPVFTDEKLYLGAGSGIVTKCKLTIEENNTATNISTPKIVSSGDTVGQFNIETTAEGRNSNYNKLETSIQGAGWLGLYAQYAPDTSYENTTYFPVFTTCEKLSLKTTADTTYPNSTLTTTAVVLGIAKGAQPITDISHDWISSFELDVEYFPITYQDASYDQKFQVNPHFTGERLYLASGSGIVTKSKLTIEENTTSLNKTIPKVVSSGGTVGEFQMDITAEGKNSNYNWLESNVKGTGYLDLYAQYAPDISYENTTYFPVFTTCEKLDLVTTSTTSCPNSTLTYAGDVLGISRGAQAITDISHDWDSHIILDVEYFPLTYQDYSYDQKFQISPIFTGEKLYLMSGSGIIIKIALTLEENSTSAGKTIPKVVSSGGTAGDFRIDTTAEGRNSNYNWLESNIKGVGWLDLYAQYAPDTSYENTTYFPVFTQCGKLDNLDTTAVTVSGVSSELTYTVDTVLGIAKGAQAITEISHDWQSQLQIEVEYFPITYNGSSYDQKWQVNPYFTGERLYLASGAGLVTKMSLILEENSSSAGKTIPKIVGVGDFVGAITDMETTTNSKNSNWNWLESNMRGVCYTNFYAQYAPDISYENITFTSTFSDCTSLDLTQRATESTSYMYAENVKGFMNGAEYLHFNNSPLDNIAINETFNLRHHLVNISGTIFNETWSVRPWQYDDILVILRGTGNMTKLNFTVNDSNTSHPEIEAFGYLRGDYDLTANIILPHYMHVYANGTNVSAMSNESKGGFGIKFKT